MVASGEAQASWRQRWWLHGNGSRLPFRQDPRVLVFRNATIGSQVAATSQTDRFTRRSQGAIIEGPRREMPKRRQTGWRHVMGYSGIWHMRAGCRVH